MKIYVASSWRNARQPEIVERLRAEGHEVYDFRNPKPGNQGFHWSEIDPNWKQWTPEQFVDSLAHPIAEAGFGLDWEAMKWADACVMVMPCGRSAHIEAGYFVGAGKKLVILLSDGEPELMYKMADAVCVHISEVIEQLRNALTADQRAIIQDTLNRSLSNAREDCTRCWALHECPSPGLFQSDICPALIGRLVMSHFEYCWSSRPKQIRLNRTVRADGMFCKMAAPPGLYEPMINPYGAVSVNTPDGTTLGLRPGEFEWVENDAKPETTITTTGETTIDIPDSEVENGHWFSVDQQGSEGE